MKKEKRLILVVVLVAVAFAVVVAAAAADPSLESSTARLRLLDNSLISNYNAEIFF